MSFFGFELSISSTKYTFSSNLANLFKQSLGWTGTCFIKVTSRSLLFYLSCCNCQAYFLFFFSMFHEDEEVLVSQIKHHVFFLLANLSLGWTNICFTNLTSSFVFLANMSLGWTGTCFKNTSSSSGEGIGAFFLEIFLYF